MAKGGTSTSFERYLRYGLPYIDTLRRERPEILGSTSQLKHSKDVIEPLTKQPFKKRIVELKQVCPAVLLSPSFNPLWSRFLCAPEYLEKLSRLFNCAGFAGL